MASGYRASPRPTRAKRFFASVVIKIIDRMVPAVQEKVVFHSVPDIDDNVVQLLRQRDRAYRIVLLAENVGLARERADRLRLNLDGVAVIKKSSIRGIWAYLRSRVAVSSHGLYGGGVRTRGKLSLSPWHGEFGKQIGQFAGQFTPQFDVTVVSSAISGWLRCTEFALHPRAIRVWGTPRQDALRAVPQTLVRAKGNRRWVVYVPTYRTAHEHLRRCDGDPRSVTRGIEALEQIVDESTVVWVRNHPMESLHTDTPALRDATDASLALMGVTFYEFLAACDVLITDYSSVWIDFLLLERPVIGFVPDIAEYRNNRGLALEPYESWFPGPLASDEGDLIAATRAALQDLRGSHELTRIRRLLHSRELCVEGRTKDFWELIRECV